MNATQGTHTHTHRNTRFVYRATTKGSPWSSTATKKGGVPHTQIHTHTHTHYCLFSVGSFAGIEREHIYKSISIYICVHIHFSHGPRQEKRAKKGTEI